MTNSLKVFLCLFASVSVSALAQNYSPPLQLSGADNLYWGDLHVHSNASADAFAFGNTRLTADDAFRFARGESITSASGVPARLRRPLDFLLVADHAEFIGVFPKLVDRDAELLATDLGASWSAIMDKAGNIGAVIPQWLARINDPDYEQELSAQYRLSVWESIVESAQRNHRPGQFTALIGYEWTSMLEGNNLHRVVLYRDGPERTSKVVPFSTLDSKDPEELWNSLEQYEQQTGGKAMAIAHNGNISNGMMFAETTLAGSPIDANYARRRLRWEPLYEVTQVKGDGESHPFLSPEDEFANFETWDGDNIARTQSKNNSMLKHEYARSALKLGLEIESRVGTNPYQFGLIGSTDSHTGLATADDSNFFGKFPDSEPSAERLTNKMGGLLWQNWRLAASGYTAVWAQENTRAAIYDALARREVYATTGPRIALRFFAGWDFTQSHLNSPDLAQYGYKTGVPMGGVLLSNSNQRARAKTPQFMVQALKDPDGANLDRIQIIKGWIDEQGRAQEKIYEVALSDGRVADEMTGKATALRSTVNVREASYSNSVGATTLSALWQDPDFDEAQSAFYYARVIEISTPRWSTYDAKHFDVPLPVGAPAETQERAYSSPIWYQPPE
ncbi:MAG: DUF3604 domain-containing protein [Halioglobus sp.]